MPAFPLVVALTWWVKHHPPNLSLRVIRVAVCLLSLAAGASLTVPAVLG